MPGTLMEMFRIECFDPVKKWPKCTENVDFTEILHSCHTYYFKISKIFFFCTVLCEKQEIQCIECLVQSLVEITQSTAIDGVIT